MKLKILFLLVLPHPSWHWFLVWC